MNEEWKTLACNNITYQGYKINKTGQVKNKKTGKLLKINWRGDEAYVTVRQDGAGKKIILAQAIEESFREAPDAASDEVWRGFPFTDLDAAEENQNKSRENPELLTENQEEIKINSGKINKNTELQKKKNIFARAAVGIIKVWALIWAIIYWMLSMLGCFIYFLNFFWKQVMLPLFSLLSQLPRRIIKCFSSILSKIKKVGSKWFLNFQNTWRNTFGTMSKIEVALQEFLAAVRDELIEIISALIKMVFWFAKSAVKLVIVLCSTCVGIIIYIIKILGQMVWWFLKLLYNNTILIILLLTAGIIVSCSMHLNVINNADDDTGSDIEYVESYTEEGQLITTAQLQQFSESVMKELIGHYYDEYGIQGSRVYPDLEFKGLSVMTNPVQIRVVCNNNQYDFKNPELEEELIQYYQAIKTYMRDSGLWQTECVVLLEDGEVILAQINKDGLTYSSYDKQNNTWGYRDEEL